MLTVLVTGACGQEGVREEALFDGPVEPGEREWLETGWDTLWAVESVEDTLLQNPRILRAWEGGAYVWDEGGGRLLSFDEGGSLRWAFGAPGRGPEEFAQVLDLRVGSGGEAYVHDAGNARVTVVDSTGRIDRRVPLAHLPHAGSMVVLSDTLLVFLATSAPEAPLRALDLEGNEVARADLPWERFQELTSLSRQGGMASHGDQWVFGFRVGNGWFPYEGLEHRGFYGGFIEHQDFPVLAVTENGNQRTVRMVSPTGCTACSLSLTDSLLVVHYGGESEEARQVLDLYALTDGAYVGSRLLPHWSQAVDVTGSRVYTLRSDPFPELAAFHMVPPGHD